MTLAVGQELLDIVDANDQKIGVTSRAEIHANQFMHRAVHILIFNQHGDFFTQKRSMNKDENPGLWDTSAAGHVDSGESYDGCVMREIREELGIKLEVVPRRLFLIPPSKRNGMEFSAIYKCIYSGPMILQADEIDEGKWLTPSDVDRQVAADNPEFTTIFKDIWRRYRDLRAE